jgi:flavorubredoxin
MPAHVDQIADRIYRISTFVADAAPGGFTFNQFLVDAAEPLLFHTGPRALFDEVSAAIEQVLPVRRLRWISFGHVEADECGAMNHFLAAAPQAQVMHGTLACVTSLNDLCDRPPRALADGEVVELGEGPAGPRVVELATPHVPHNWESHMLFEEQTGTLFSGDVCSQPGGGPAVTAGDVMEAAIAAEELFRQTSMGPAVPATFRRLAELKPQTLAVMHGSSYNGDCAALLSAMADVYEQRFGCATQLQNAR